METWQQLEENTYKFLESVYGSMCDITALGKSDSTQPDIRIDTDKSSFYIEVKKANAQSGQFVLIPEEKERKFIFSPRNKSEQNAYTDIIIKHMNDNFDEYCEAGTAGRSIMINSEIFNKWIIDYYSSKGVKYLITKNGGFIILPIHKFGNYFKIAANYRIKRSGSTTPSKVQQIKIIKYLESELNMKCVQIKDKIYIKDKVNKKNERFEIDEYEYFISKRIDIYEIRRLSNTYNMNVIFSIDLRIDQDPADLKLFESEF